MAAFRTAFPAAPEESPANSQGPPQQGGGSVSPLHTGGLPNPEWPTSSDCPAPAGPVSPDRLSCPSQKQRRAFQQAIKRLLRKLGPGQVQQARLIHGSSDIQTGPPSIISSCHGRAQNLSSRPGHSWSHMDGDQQVPLSSGLCRKWPHSHICSQRGVQTRGRTSKSLLIVPNGGRFICSLCP